MPLQGKRIAFIGGGTMAEAMMRGVFEKHLMPPSHVLVTGPRRERRADLTKRFGDFVDTIRCELELADEEVQYGIVQAIEAA